MSSTEFIGREFTQSQPTAGQLRLLAKPRLIERKSLAKGQDPIPLVTRQSFQTYRDTSGRYSQRTATYAWGALSRHILGKQQQYKETEPLPETTAVLLGAAALHAIKPQIIGYYPEEFARVATIATREKHTGIIGAVSAGFLLDLAVAITAELQLTAQET